MNERNQIEVLVLSNTYSYLSSKWVKQASLGEAKKKHLFQYLNDQLFFSSLWNHILNVAEVDYIIEKVI